MSPKWSKPLGILEVLARSWAFMISTLPSSDCSRGLRPWKPMSQHGQSSHIYRLLENQTWREQRPLTIPLGIYQCHGMSELEGPLETHSYLQVRDPRPRDVAQLIALLVSTEVRPEAWLPGCSLVLFIFPLHGKPIWISSKPWGYRPVPMVLAHIGAKNVFQAHFRHRFGFRLPHPPCNCSQRSGRTLECRGPDCHRRDPASVLCFSKSMLEPWLSKGFI